MADIMSGSSHAPGSGFAAPAPAMAPLGRDARYRSSGKRPTFRKGHTHTGSPGSRRACEPRLRVAIRPEQRLLASLEVIRPVP
jgi:hypothetical protein